MKADADALLSMMHEAGRASMFNEIRDYAIASADEAKEIDPAVMDVTVIWNDCFSDGMSDHNAEMVQVRERKDGNIYTEGLVRQAMRNLGYSPQMVNEAISKSYGLVGIIKGKVEWLA